MSGINPVTEKSCWKTCPVCFKCSEYGRHSGCRTCPARNDPMRRFYPDPDSYCDCHNGTLRHRTQTGRLIVRQFPGDPYRQGEMAVDTETQDEKDWNAYLQKTREARQDPYWDPVQFSDGSSTQQWNQSYRDGLSGW